MRSTSRAVRVSSTRDICIFCATRQSAFAALPNPSQQRYLNSSSKAPQYAAEGQVYKQPEEPTRPMSQAEKMRALLQGSLPKASPPRSSPPQRTAPSYNASQQHHQRQPLPTRIPLRRTVDSSMQDDRESRYSHNQIRNTQPRFENRGPPGSTRFNVSMNARPPVGDLPAFGTGHLRRRNEPPPRRPFFQSGGQNERQTGAQSGRTPPNRLNQAEIDQLLGNTSSNDIQRDRPLTYAPLRRNTNVRSKCMHCGREDHTSVNCPTAPVLRQDKPSYDTEALLQKQGTNFERTPLSIVEREDRPRKEVSDRRRSRFRMEQEAQQEVNRFEDPQRRHRTTFERRNRRIMRDEDDEVDRYVDKTELKRQRKEARKKMKEQKVAPTPVLLPEYISVTNLASLLRVRVEDFVAKLEDLGFEDVQNDHILNAEHAGLIAQEYNFEPILQTAEDDGDLHPAPAPSPEDYAQLPVRPPVVTIMGHVDHGKTTILDYIRSTTVAANEFGGITQHIGAFSVPIGSGKNITFLDTPGHSAFETMRARGANVTDIVVLVVAADDSVMPQTVEAIKHAQAAKVPMIVAINKIDKPQANPDAVKLDLGRHGIEVEDFGGDVQAILVSGKTGKGIPDLEEAISTLSEMLDHRADPQAKVEGWILEGTTKKSGRVATVLVRSGTLRVGDILVAGTTWARVRTLRNEAGIAVNDVGPGMPVEVDGWREQPIAGDEVLQADDEQQGHAVAELRIEKLKREQMAKDMEAINESRRLEEERKQAEKAAAEAIANGELPEESVTKKESGPEVIPFIVKGDVSGSVEAVIDSISALGNAEIGTRILRHGVGAPSEFDIQHAADAKGHIVNFNTTVPNHILAMAEEKGVKILDSNIIYRVVENVKTMLEDRLPPRITQKVTGEAEVAMVFNIGLGGKKKMRVAGSKVRNGVVEKGTKAKVLRKDVVVFDGVISSLKSQKKDVQEMRKDTECGIAFEGWDEFQTGDKVQCYTEEKVKRNL